jgi:hydrogenase maturation protease
VIAPVLVIGVGNPSRGDDALGPMLAERLEAWLTEQAVAGVEVLSDIQLNIEHALDVEGRRRVLFVDASADGAAPFACGSVLPARDGSISTHSVSPQAVMQVCRELGLARPPTAELLAVRGGSFELGDGLSPSAERNLAAAWTFLKGWCQEAARGCGASPPPSV